MNDFITVIYYLAWGVFIIALLYLGSRLIAKAFFESKKEYINELKTLEKEDSNGKIKR